MYKLNNLNISILKSFKSAVIYIIFLVLSINACFAETNNLPPKHLHWPFEGIFGKFDRQSAQRGLQVYLEVCSACHALNHLYYRNLSGIGFSEAEIAAIAAKYNVKVGPNAQGEMYERPAIPSDMFARPYPNEEAARASNNGAYPADLSLIVKAREHGANYVYSILTGYTDPPSDFKLLSGLYYNPYFPNKQIAMPPPLTNGQVTYLDGTPSTVEQMAKDLVIFLQYAAEPEMESRKAMGLKVLLYLFVFTILFMIAKKRVWSKLDKK